MKLLVLTQKVDRADPVLGFFHNWLKQLAERFEEVSVVCLEKGTFELPANVKVYSLGKEVRRNRLLYIKNFYQYVVGLNSDYDAVFVHMNQEYVLLGGFFWKLLGKKVYFWRNHPKGNLLTYLAVWLSDKVFCTSDKAFTKRFSKTILMPVGIDTDIFKYEIRSTKYERLKDSILFLSRMSPIKRPDLLIGALKVLKSKNIDFVCNFYGEALPKDQKYFESLKEKVKNINLEDNVRFNGAVPNYETPQVYNEHGIFINLTPSGSLDKTILEAGACGCIPIVINDFFKDIFEPEMLAKDDAEDLAEKISFWLAADPIKIEEVKTKIRQYVLENHSLDSLIKKLYVQISS